MSLRKKEGVGEKMSLLRPEEYEAKLEIAKKSLDRIPALKKKLKGHYTPIITGVEDNLEDLRSIYFCFSELFGRPGAEVFYTDSPEKLSKEYRSRLVIVASVKERVELNASRFMDGISELLIPQEKREYYLDNPEVMYGDILSGIELLINLEEGR